jgi:hypothetical protein
MRRQVSSWDTAHVLLTMTTMAAKLGILAACSLTCALLPVEDSEQAIASVLYRITSVIQLSGSYNSTPSTANQSADTWRPVVRFMAAGNGIFSNGDLHCMEIPAVHVSDTAAAGLT